MTVMKLAVIGGVLLLGLAFVLLASGGAKARAKEEAAEKAEKTAAQKAAPD